MQKNIVMLCSLDTKANEAAYLRERIEQLGANTLLVDIGYGGKARLEADITAADVAIAAGSDIESIWAMQDTGAASMLMMQGAILCIQELFREGRCDGAIAFGGASNTTVATGIMKTLPIGVPKLAVSSAAAMPAYSALYFGSRDITMMNAVVDMSGLNDLTKGFLKQGAAAIVGMASASEGRLRPSGALKLIAVSSFRFAEACSQLVMAELEKLGYAPIPFHAQGVGEDAMEALIAQKLFKGVVDIVPAGLSEYMLGGNRAAKPERLEAAGKAGVPQVIAPSGFDMISCGPIGRKDIGDPLWCERAIAERQISIPDRFRVEARTTAGEVADIARAVAGKMNDATGPASVFVPLRGWSSLSIAGAELHNPEADAAFIPALRKTLDSNVRLVEIDAELNSDTFAHALVQELDGMIKSVEQQSDKLEEVS